MSEVICPTCKHPDDKHSFGGCLQAISRVGVPLRQVCPCRETPEAIRDQALGAELVAKWKRGQAEELAGALVENVDVEFDELDIRSMADPILFSYLENLGYEWADGSWSRIGELP